LRGLKQLADFAAIGLLKIETLMASRVRYVLEVLFQGGIVLAYG
jgi:hypothetical protein